MALDASPAMLLTKKSNPRDPFSFLAHVQQSIVILGEAGLELVAQIDQRRGQSFVNELHEGDCPADTAIAVCERVNGFKLVVCQCDTDESGKSIIIFEVPFQLRHAILDFMWRRGHKTGLLNIARSTDMGLNGSESSQLFIRSTHPAQQ